jgi:hypothetical protein
MRFTEPEAVSCHLIEIGIAAFRLHVRQHFDSGLFKEARIGETWRFEIRLQVFSTLNRPNFQDPDRLVGKFESWAYPVDT